jgi:hypothetical protein
MMTMSLKQHATESGQLLVTAAAKNDLTDFMLLALPQKLGSHLNDLWGSQLQIPRLEPMIGLIRATSLNSHLPRYHMK